MSGDATFQYLFASESSATPKTVKRMIWCCSDIKTYSAQKKLKNNNVNKPYAHPCEKENTCKEH